MPPKKIQFDLDWNTVKEPMPKRKAATPYVESAFILEYRRARDLALLADIFVSEDTKQLIRERWQS